MQLSEKIRSISEKETVSELNTMLDKGTHVSISWFGRRVVSIEGYKGCVAIDDLARKYLSVFPSEADLQQKYECYKLWDRFQKLYDESNQVSWLFKCLVWVREIRLCLYPLLRIDHPMLTIQEKGWSKINELVAFSLKEWKQKFSGDIPEKTNQGEDGFDERRWKDPNLLFSPCFRDFKKYIQRSNKP